MESFSDSERFYFFKRREDTHKYLQILGLSLSVVSHQYKYDELIVKHVQADLNNSEPEFLKSGIVEIYKCLKSIDSAEPPSDELIESAFANKSNAIHEISKQVDENWLSRYRGEFERIKKVAIQELKTEMSEFKIRLGRVNIDVEIENDEIQFKRFGEILTDMNTLIEPLIENPYPLIFSNLRAYRLFSHLHSVFEGNNSRLADYSFIYRSMHKDGFILDGVKSGKFKNWLIETFDFSDLNAKLKTIDNCTTPLKESVYKTIKGIAIK